MSLTDSDSDFQDDESDWGPLQTVEEAEKQQQEKKLKNYKSKGAYCWKCNNCIIWIPTTTTNSNNNKCFRCNNQINIKTKPTYKAHYITPQKLKWTCFTCKGTNNNIRSNWCTNGDCTNYITIKLAQDIIYKPSSIENKLYPIMITYT